MNPRTLITSLCVLLFAGSAGAEVVRLDLGVSESGIAVRDGQGEALFLWSDGAYLELSIGAPEGNVLPVEVPVGGLHLGDVNSEHRASLRITLLEPARGTIRLREDGRFELRLTAHIKASDPVRERSRIYQIELTTEQPPSPVPGEPTYEGRRLDPSTGALDLVTTGQVLHADGKPAGVFHAVLAGRLSRLPVALTALREP
jgi:hypothetical protein